MSQLRNLQLKNKIPHLPPYKLQRIKMTKRRGALAYLKTQSMSLATS
jgi:hypothetical protein